MGDLRKLKHLFPVRAWLRARQPFNSEAELKQTFAAELARRAGGTPESTLDWYEARFMPRFTKVLEKRGIVREGLIPLLERLKRRSVQMAVVSDFGFVAERLRALRIPIEFFDFMMGAEIYGTMKPTSVPYLDIAEKWALSPSNILLIGDRFDSDAMSASQTGAQFLGIAGDKHAGPDFEAWSDAVSIIDTKTQVN